MKKALVLIIGIALVSFTITSCKKDYTCACKAYLNSGSLFDKSQHSYHDTKKNAKDLCQQYEDKKNEEGKAFNLHVKCSIQ